MSKTDIATAAALAAVQTHTGAIYRHGPNDSREFIGLASRIETGLWASTWDRGAYGGIVYGQRQGTLQVIDLFLHLHGPNGTMIELPAR